jgi:hypothetical protein
MDLTTDLRAQIHSYVEGRSTLEDLRMWLADHVQEIADAGSAELDELDGLVWVLISELDYGHRDEAEVRELLAEALNGQLSRPEEPRLESGADAGLRSAHGVRRDS